MQPRVHRRGSRTLTPSRLFEHRAHLGDGPGKLGEGDLAELGEAPGSAVVALDHLLGAMARAGVDVLTVKKAEVDEIFVVNATLAALNPLGVQLGLAREKGLLSKDRQWPWCVFINDLRVIADLVGSPSEFILALKRRLDVNPTPYAPHDELDLLCKFFDDGLYHEPGELNGIDLVGLHGYTDMLDRWYLVRPHGVDVKRPGRALPAHVGALVTAIEAAGKARRTQAALRILALDQKGLDKIAWFLGERRPISLADGKEHDMTLQFRLPYVRGISIYVSPTGKLRTSAYRHVAQKLKVGGAVAGADAESSAARMDADEELLAGRASSPRCSWTRRALMDAVRSTSRARRSGIFSNVAPPPIASATVARSRAAYEGSELSERWTRALAD